MLPAGFFGRDEEARFKLVAAPLSTYSDENKAPTPPQWVRAAASEPLIIRAFNQSGGWMAWEGLSNDGVIDWKPDGPWTFPPS